MSTVALTQCWYTRQHHPASHPKERVEGAFYAHCRHCRRPIFSMDGQFWHIDGGFNVETLSENANSFLAIVDVVDGMIIARVAVPAQAEDDFVEALKEQIREQYGIGEDGNNLAIQDYRPGKRAAQSSGRKKRNPPAKGASAA
jgi:hypothetical protein